MLVPALEAGGSDRTALAFPDRSMSFAQLDAAASAVAAELAGCARVAVLAEPRIETCVAVVGALLAGVPAIPVNPRSGPSELAHVVSDAQPDAIAVAVGTAVPEAFGAQRRISVDLDATTPAGRQRAVPQ
ncbi:MAG TPA: AMP-binding protein, partial [Solirubrobacteraceae bacterium]